MGKKPFRVAVIGAGASGLAAIKCCLDENLEVICFEKSNDIGGLWRFTENPEPGRAGVYRSTTINTSKELLAYSTFPPPAEFPNFMHHRKLYEYMKLYAGKYNLENHIKLNAEVLSVEKSDNFKETGDWVVTFCTVQSQDIEQRLFNAVMVCSGHHAYPNDPSENIPGRSKFRGRVLHGHAYRDHQPFVGRRVMVIGLGNTGGDLAAELSRHAEKLLLSTKRGAWVINRMARKGIPYDCEVVTRLFHYIIQITPLAVLNGMYERKMNLRFDHELYGIKPNHRIRSQHPLINDELPSRIANGTVTIVPNVKSFAEDGVVTSDGKLHYVDDVIFATGYRIKFPFLPPDVVSVDKSNNISPLYKHVFPACLSDSPTLAIIGNVQPLGGLMPIAEMQSRWATRVFKGLCQLPCQVKIAKEIAQIRKSLQTRYVNSDRHTIQVDYVEYMDSLADEIRVKPNVFSMALVSPKLAWKVLVEPATSYQYRLCGPGKWDGAQSAIEGQWHRVLSGFSRQPSRFNSNHSRSEPRSSVSFISTNIKWSSRDHSFAFFISFFVIACAMLTLGIIL